LLGPFVERADELFGSVLRPLRIPPHPILTARFGLRAIRSCDGLVRSWFESDAARALFGGSAAHTIGSLAAAGTAAVGLMLTLGGHAYGWPCARGGSGAITSALLGHLRERGVEVRTRHEVRALSDVPEARAILFDVTPKQLVAIAGDAIGRRYRAQLERFRLGPGIFKVDWALDGPVPWTAEACRRAGTVHVVGSYDELRASENAAASGQVPERPFVLFAQQSVFDDTRAPAGKHTGWAYCHVPNGCTVDMTERIEAQIERFAPGFRDLVRARHSTDAAQLEAGNPNMSGGDIAGGANTLRQLIFRPSLRWNPYATGNPRLFLCSSSTPPGGGVHGMCGYWAARTALRRF
jgi:phytoene dehydrogenase-like protein